MSFLESEKSKAIRWFRNIAELLESGRAELLPNSLLREDHGNQLSLSGTIIPSKTTVNPGKTVVTEKKEQSVSTRPVKRMTPAHATQCYDLKIRSYTCPTCSHFKTNSETGLKKHYNRCESKALDA